MEKCIICGENIKKKDETIESLRGKLAHLGCYESGGDYASQVFKIENGEVEKTIFDNDFVYYSDSGDDYSLPEPIKSVEWVNTDGWRGYTEWKYLDGFKEVAEGWITGYPDEYTERKRTLGEMFEDLESGELVAPVTLYWIFGVTSNVFSQASAIVIRKEDEKELEKWLLEINGGIKGLQEKFN